MLFSGTAQFATAKPYFFQGLIVAMEYPAYVLHKFLRFLIQEIPYLFRFFKLFFSSTSKRAENTGCALLDVALGFFLWLSQPIWLHWACGATQKGKAYARAFDVRAFPCVRTVPLLFLFPRGLWLSPFFVSPGGKEREGRERVLGSVGARAVWCWLDQPKNMLKMLCMQAWKMSFLRGFFYQKKSK